LSNNSVRKGLEQLVNAIRQIAYADHHLLADAVHPDLFIRETTLAIEHGVRLVCQQIDPYAPSA